MRLRLALLAALMACGHSEPFAAPVNTPLGPAGSGPDVLLTLNSGADYWPNVSQDGRSILYQFSQPGRADDDRCVGLLPIAGGTQLWSMCDNRLGEADSTNGFSTFALGSDGRLLYAEEENRALAPGTPINMTLWLADTAAPFARRALLRLPTAVGGDGIDWLADAAWTGPTSFVALGSRLVGRGTCRFCIQQDTFFVGVAVVAGSITANGVTLSEVSGTAGAAVYTLAENGASMVFAATGSVAVQRVALNGDTATMVASLPTAGGTQAITGLSCRGTTCVATTSVVPPAGDVDDNVVSSGALWSIDLTTGAVQLLASATGGTSLPPAWSSPHIVSAAGDVVLQVGGSPGTLAMANIPGGDLHLFKGIVH